MYSGFSSDPGEIHPGTDVELKKLRLFIYLFINSHFFLGTAFRPAVARAQFCRGVCQLRAAALQHASW
ncbi:hypothetical protein T492DRAFT_946041 [Pavlovales sp. CCMP2436]|nr:hypothetical protein T492DRAFT_946041 [Pavlovales sp. CCMP2436]